MDASGDHNGRRRRDRDGWRWRDEQRSDRWTAVTTKAAAAAAAAACGGGVRLFSVTSDGTLRGEMKRYVKNMSGHKFAECWGGRSANLCFYDQHTHNSNRVKNKVKKTRICVFMTKIFVSLRF